jgi:hypothetical protein
MEPTYNPILLNSSSDYDHWFLVVKAMSADVWKYIDPSLSTEPKLPSLPQEPTTPSINRDEYGIARLTAAELNLYKIQYMIYKDRRDRVQKVLEKIAKVHRHILTTISPELIPFVRTRESAYQLLVTLMRRYELRQEDRDSVIDPISGMTGGGIFRF